MGIYPYAGSGYDKYWHYENPDPSTHPYALRVALEVVDEALVKIRKRGSQIYQVRSGAIIVQELVHAVLRLLPGIITEHIKQIEKYEKENSGNIENYFDPESEEQKDEENDKDTQGEGDDMEDQDQN